jgi:hypothetical protein
MAAQNLEIAINSALPTFRRNKKDEKYRAKVQSWSVLSVSADFQV